MQNNKVMPPKYWLYIWGILVAFFAFSYVAYTPSEVIAGIITSIMVAAVFTLWLAVIHTLWYAGHIIYKILAVLLAGIAALIVVLLIQFAYENLIWKKKAINEV
ncbi:hypothetical protein [Methanolobus psychrotolerans]|uniref:hypothetical protein n=1 Tax=Methanolobus psychrotolerans TaxID=1874706 RepID=UPI000B91690D|nr:hypothetical protein [Methanolobus psychrotolerans]